MRVSVQILRKVDITGYSQEDKEIGLRQIIIVNHLVVILLIFKI